MPWRKGDREVGGDVDGGLQNHQGRSLARTARTLEISLGRGKPHGPKHAEGTLNLELFGENQRTQAQVRGSKGEKFGWGGRLWEPILS